MTFETALERVEGYLTSYFSIEEYDEIEEILKALKKEHSEDAISRKAVNELQRYRYNYGDTAITCVSLASINELPTITPQKEVGYWITESINNSENIQDGYMQKIYCSCCKERFSYITSYCPSCGAKMEVEG